MRKLVGLLVIVLALVGCASAAYDPTPDLDPDAIAAAKADGAFGSTEIAVGDSATGSTSGDGLVLYALQLQDGDEIRITVSRTSGDLRPSAYLYRGTTQHVRPDELDASSERVQLDYDIENGGEHHIVVKPYRGEGAGDFALSVECLGGTCAGIPNDPIAAQGQCISGAAACAIAELPSYNGFVGSVRARSIFEGCLANEGAHCVDACGDADGQEACDTIIGTLPDFADQEPACITALNTCLDGCAEHSGYYTPTDLSETTAGACWTGYFGNCLEYVGGHAACGGDYAEGSIAECRAYCEGTEGAWDEGPWDGCMEPCDEMQGELDDFITSVANDVGEYFDPSASTALAPTTYDQIPRWVMSTVQWRIDRFNDEAQRNMRTDTAERWDEAPYTITRNGEVIGYVIGVWYAIDDPLFDGGGETLYMNLDGDLVESVEWWG